jgi:hypothetical protein
MLLTRFCQLEVRDMLESTDQLGRARVQYVVFWELTCIVPRSAVTVQDSSFHEFAFDQADRGRLVSYIIPSQRSEDSLSYSNQSRGQEFLAECVGFRAAGGTDSMPGADAQDASPLGHYSLVLFCGTEFDLIIIIETEEGKQYRRSI